MSASVHVIADQLLFSTFINECVVYLNRIQFDAAHPWMDWTGLGYYK